MGEVGHLVRRLWASVRRGGPTEADRAWVAEVLSPSEYQLWARQDPPDRRHSASVARQVHRALAGGSLAGGSLAGGSLGGGESGEGAPLSEDSRWVLAGALLHDVGKIEAGLGTWGRVWATLVSKIVGPGRARRWTERSGCRGRIGRYLAHPEIGAELLRAARSDPRTVAWAAQHHQPPDQWTVPAEIARMLHAFDND